MCIYRLGVLCWPVGWLAKHHTKRCLESQNNMVSHATFVGAANMLAGLIFTATHMPICPFFTTYPDLVLCTSPLWNAISLSLGTPAPYLCLITALLLHCSFSFSSCCLVLLFICSLYCPSLLFMLVVCLMAYAVGFLLMVLSISASGSVFMFECLLDQCCKYVPAVTAVGFKCDLFHVMHLPFVVS